MVRTKVFAMISHLLWVAVAKLWHGLSRSLKISMVGLWWFMAIYSSSFGTCTEEH